MSVTVPTDQELIQQVLAGNKQRYELLVQRHQSFVFSIALKYTQNREDAEELAQSAFVKAYLNMRDFRGDAKFTTWLYTIVSSLCLSFLRKKKLVVHSLEQEAVLNMAAGYASHLQADGIEQRSRSQLLAKAMEMLGPDDATILSLFYHGEQSLEEIAGIMQIAPNNAKVKLHRARQRLKDIMEQFFAAELKEMLYF